MFSILFSRFSADWEERLPWWLDAMVRVGGSTCERKVLI